MGTAKRELQNTQQRPPLAPHRIPSPTLCTCADLFGSHLLGDGKGQLL